MSSVSGWKPLQRFFGLLSLDSKDISYIYLYAIFAGVITLSLPLGIQAIIGLIAGGTMSNSLYILVGLVSLATALTGVLKIMQLVVAETLQRRIFARSAFEFSFRLPQIRLESLQNRYPPELVNRFFDTLTIQKGIPKLLMDFSSAAFNIVFGLILISFYHPFFAFFGISILVLVFLIFRVTGPGGLRTSLVESKYKYAVAHWLEEIGRANTTFKLSNGDRLSMQKTDSLVVKYLDARKSHFRVLMSQFGSMVGFKTVVTAALLLLGSMLVVQNQINIGQFVAAEIVVLQVISAVEKLILSMETIYDMLTGLEKIGFVMDIPLDKEGGVPFKEVDTGKGIAVDLKNVKFKFKDDQNYTLRNVSLNIQPNEKICITGYNRAGKSTLIRLMSGFFHDYEGTITFNGVPVSNLNIKDLHNRIGEFTSDLDIFEGTILENIKMGYLDITMKEILGVAKTIGLDKFVSQLPKGYQTALLPGGKNVPGSIRNKIILSRAMITQPQLFTLEDVFANMEAEDKTEMIELLTDKANNWTLVAVSDDVEFAKKCDRILIMRRGEIIESGTFEEIQECPHFKNVFR
ncbi:MAG: ATP-binding cassette domain-containing protein [Bacteroidota bacterium]